METFDLVILCWAFSKRGKVMRNWFVASALLLALVGVAAAHAQPVLTPSQIRPIPVPGLVLARVTGDTVALTTGAHGSVASAPSAPLAPVSALAAFRINFENGDHKIRRVQVLPAGELVRFALNDMGDDDPFAARAVWINMTGGQAGTASSYGGGVMQIAIPPGPANHTFALRGFEFRRRDGTDNNVRAMSVRLAPGGAAIEVSLIDDQRADFRPSQRRPACSGCSSQRPYDVTVQYVWIPNALVLSAGSITGNEFGREAAQIGSGNSVIRGFSFAFGNSDHYIAHIEADVSGGGNARFQDVNAGDPMRWQIDYATLREH